MKSLVFAIVVTLCCCSPKPPVQVAHAAAPDCKCKEGAECPDYEAEMDRSTPGCVISPEALPRKDNVFERADVKRIFIACSSAASFLPSKCPNETIKVTVINGPLVCHWECGHAGPHQPHHGPWKLMSAEIKQ